jgi:RNA polymerase sigma-70 factor, ECF subfamily
MPPNEPTDADEVRQTLSGDREAFGRLFDRHARQVRTVVAAVSGDFGEVEDMTQETFLRAYRQLPSLRDVDGFRGWIQGIARFVARERCRRLVRNPLPISDNETQLVSDDTSQEMVQQHEEQQRVMAAVSGLPERERLAVHAYFFHEQNAEEAAVTMQISRSGYYAALERGIQELRKQLGTSPSFNARNKT